MKKPLLIMFVGVPGSGKTTFARQLAEKLDAVHINSHGFRVALKDLIDSSRYSMDIPEERAKIDAAIFSAMDYAARQILTSGTTVLYDCNANKRADRLAKQHLARLSGGELCVVRLVASESVALQRAVDREDNENQAKFSREVAQRIIREFSDAIEEPLPDENAVEISGELPFEEQFAIFQNFVEKLT